MFDAAMNQSLLKALHLNLTNATNDDSPTLPPLPDLYSINQPSITIIDRYVTPVWYFIGFPGNLLSFLVWIQPKMRPSSGSYLAALAASDFLFLVLHLLFELQSAWNVTLLSFPVLCETFPVFFLASQHLSPLLVLGFTVERYISVCHPFQRERFCNSRRTVAIIVVLSVASLSIHLVQAYFWKYDAEKNDCIVRDEVIANDTGSIWSVWSWVTELLVFGIVPLIILCLNILVIHEARKLSDHENKLLRRQVRRRTGFHKTSAPSATTVMLLAVSFNLIATTLPATVAYAIYYSFPMGRLDITLEEVSTDPQWQRHFSYWHARKIIEEVCMSHYAGNFCIYVLTGRIFRKELVRLIRKWTGGLCPKTAKDGESTWNGEFSYTKAEPSCNYNGITTV